MIIKCQNFDHKKHTGYYNVHEFLFVDGVGFFSRREKSALQQHYTFGHMHISSFRIKNEMHMFHTYCGHGHCVLWMKISSM